MLFFFTVNTIDSKKYTQAKTGAETFQIAKEVWAKRGPLGHTGWDRDRLSVFPPDVERANLTARDGM